MAENARNTLAKCLAGIFGVGLFFALVAAGSGTSDGCLDATLSRCGDSGYSLDGRTIVVGLVCLVVALAALAVAIAIRKRMGGPIIGPWKPW